MTKLDCDEGLGVYRGKYSLWPRRLGIAADDLIANPDDHPAWDAIHTPLTLQPYDSRMYPSCTNRTFQNLGFLDTSLGRVIREFNSTLGIPEDTLRALKEVAVKCDSCYCMYSPEGYNAHVRDKKCRNSTFSRESKSHHIYIQANSCRLPKMVFSLHPS